MKKTRLTTNTIVNIKEYTLNGQPYKWIVVLNDGNGVDYREFLGNFIDLPTAARNFIHNSKRENFCGYDHISKQAVYIYR